MTDTSHWPLTVAALLGEPWPPLPDLPGVVHVASDEPLGAEHLIGVTDPAELARLLGISRKTAAQRLADTAGADQSLQPSTGHRS